MSTIKHNILFWEKSRNYFSLLCMFQNKNEAEANLNFAIYFAKKVSTKCCYVQLQVEEKESAVNSSPKDYSCNQHSFHCVWKEYQPHCFTFHLDKFYRIYSPLNLRFHSFWVEWNPRGVFWKSVVTADCLRNRCNCRPRAFWQMAYRQK